MSDNINPDHYKRLPAEAIEIIESAIDKAPSAQDAYLHGQVLKYVLRCWNKNGIEDLRKAKWYLDRLVEHCDLRESLLDISNGLVKAWACENGKAKQVYPEPEWTPKVGDWVRIKKPADTQASACIWAGSMNKYDGQIIEVKQLSEEGILHDNWGFMLDWLEPAEQPAIKQSLTTEPPDGWRWLEAGEKFFLGDTTVDGDGKPYLKLKISKQYCERHICQMSKTFVRRNRFEVGEKVVSVLDELQFVVVDKHNRLNDVYVLRSQSTGKIHQILDKLLAPYIEDAK